jgi:hypothetical protein
MTRESGVPSTSRRTPLAVASLVTRVGETVFMQVRALSFWLAVALPWLVLALSVGGILTRRPVLLAGLVVATVLCAVAGHDHAT